MESFDPIKKYLLYSLSFHALVLTLLLLFGEGERPPAPPKSQVTMIRLSRGSGDLDAPLLQKPSPSARPPAPQAPAPQPPTPAQPPIPVAKPAPVQPVQPTVPAKPSPPAPEPARPTVHLGKDKPKPQPVPPTQPPPQPAAPAPDEQKLAEALGQVQRELEQREASVPAPAPTAGSPEGGGTGGSPFGSPGGQVSAADPGLAQYQSSVRAKIIREWVRASTGPDDGQAVRTRIQVRINASGQVIGKNVVKGSGNESFDLSALRAIERASPLPPPPPGLETEALSEGFIVDFSSRMLGRK